MAVHMEICSGLINDIIWLKTVQLDGLYVPTSRISIITLLDKTLTLYCHILLISYSFMKFVAQDQVSE